MRTKLLGLLVPVLVVGLVGCGEGAVLDETAASSEATDEIVTAPGSCSIKDVDDAASRARDFIEANKRLPTYVTFGSDQVSMPSFLQVMVSALLQIKAGTNNAIAIKNYFAAPKPEDNTVRGEMPVAEYLSIANDVKAFMSANGRAPEYAADTSLGTRLGFTNLVYLYSKALDFHGANARLPNFVTLDLFSLAPVTNPISPIVGYEQINLTETWGSCGSHAGGVAIGHLRGYSTVAQVEQVEKDLYYTYGGRVYGGPGRSDLAGTYNRYLNARGVPYTAYLFTDSGAVLERINAGTPVVAHTTLWGGHYICIYGLKDEGGTWKVYFSDGAVGDGVNAALPTGNLKKWNWSTFKAYVKSGFIGFKHD